MFDSLRYAKILEKVGVQRKHAEAHVHILSKIVENDLVTKQEFRHGMKELEFRLTLKLSAVVLAMNSIMTALILKLK